MSDPWDSFFVFQKDGTLQIMNEDLYKMLDDALWVRKGKDRRFSIWWQDPKPGGDRPGNKVNVMCPC